MYKLYIVHLFFNFETNPEKSLFIYSPNLAVDHTPYAIAAAQYIANRSLARQNTNRFMTRHNEEEHLVFRHLPLYVENVTETPYEQIYVFLLYREYLSELKIKV